MLSGSSKHAPSHIPGPAEIVESRVLPHPIVAFMVVLLSFVVSSLAASIILSLLMSVTGDAKADPPELFGSAIILQVGYMLLAYGLMLGAVLALMYRGKYSLKALGLRRPRPKDLGLAVLAFLVYMASYITLVTIVEQFLPSLNLDQKQDIGFENAHGIALAFIFVMLVIVVPFVEEFLMRGLLFSSLRYRWSYWVSAIITSLLFAALHLGGGEAGAGPLWIAAIDTFVLSMVLCYLRERTGRLWAGVGLHAIKNSIAFAALFLFVSS